MALFPPCQSHTFTLMCTVPLVCTGNGQNKSHIESNIIKELNKWRKIKENKTIEKNEKKRADELSSFTISLRFVCLFFLLKEENNKKK